MATAPTQEICTSSAADGVAPAGQLPPARRSPGGLRRLAGAPLEWLRVLLFPAETVPRIVAARRFGAALGAVLLASGLAVAAIAPRLDMVPELLRKESQPAESKRQGEEQGQSDGQNGGGSGGESAMSDREFDEAVEKAYAVEVLKLAGGAILVPLKLLLLGLVLYGVARFVGGKPALRAMLALSAHAGLPGAVKSLIAALAALRLPRITPDSMATLVPLPWGSPDGPPLGRLLAGLDPFALWAVLLLAIGMPHASGVGRRKAYLTVGVCFGLFLLLTVGG